MKGLVAALMGLLAIPMSCIFCLVPPKDLGIRSTQSDYQTYVNTGGWHISELKPGLPTGQGGQVPGQEGKTVQFSGTREVKATRTSEQLTALANSNDFKSWKYFPAQNVQIRINNDGSVETSGRFLSDRIFKALSRPGLDITSEEQGYIDDYGKYAKGNPAFYMKFTGGVTNNQVNINFSKVELGGIAVPSDAMDEVNNHARSLIQRKIPKVPGLNIRSLTFQNGKMNFDGTVPDKILMLH